MKRHTTSVILVAFLAIVLAALLTGGPMIGWGMMGWGTMARGLMGGGMMGGTYLFSPFAAILTFLVCGLAIAGFVLLIFWLVRRPTSPRPSKF